MHLHHGPRHPVICHQVAGCHDWRRLVSLEHATEPWDVNLSNKVNQRMRAVTPTGQAQAEQALDHLGERGAALLIPHSRKSTTAAPRFYYCRFRFRLANQQSSGRRNWRDSGCVGERVLPVFVANLRTVRLFGTSCERYPPHTL